MKAYKKILVSTRALPILLLIFVGIILVTSRADALINIVSTFIDMMGNNIYNVGNMNVTGWLNGTSFNGTYYGNGSSLTGISTFNFSYDTYAYNQTTPAISWVQGQSYQTGTELWNTSSQVTAAVNTSGTYYQINADQLDGQHGSYYLNTASILSLTNLSNMTNCTSGNLVQGKIGSTWVCTADLFNSTTQVKTAVNNSGYYNLSVNNSAYCNGLACANPAGNTTIQVQNAINGTLGTYYQIQSDITKNDLWNTTTQIKNAVNDTVDQYVQITAKNMTSGLPFSFLNKPANCSAGQWVNGTTATGFFCAAPTVTETDPFWDANYTAFNTTWATDNWNTTTQVKNAVNDTAGQYYQIQSDTAMNTFNSTYDTASSRTSFNYYNYTASDVTDQAAVFKDVMTLPLTNGMNIQIECNLFNWANATTTGVQYRVNTTGGTNNIIIEYYTSATAQAFCSGKGNVTCSGVNSGGTTQTRTVINTYTTQTATGMFYLEMRSELAGAVPRANVTAGSWCRSIER